MNDILKLTLAGAFAMTGCLNAVAQTPGEVRIAHVYSKSGPLEAYGQQTARGFTLGLEYATQGTMTVAGRRIVVVERDDQGKPDFGRSQLAAAYADDKADIAVGPTSSGVALAMLPIAEEARKILIVDGAVADSITGDKWNRYIFRVQHTSAMAAAGTAAALDKDGVSIATLAQDYAYGREGTRAFKAALSKAKIVHEEFLPMNTTDFTAAAQRLVDGLKDKPGRKVIWINWAGAGNPYKIADLDLKRFGIEIAAVGNILSAMAIYKQFPGMEGATNYYYGIPKNPVNQWLVENHQKRYGVPPDFFTPGGMAAAIAIVEMLKRTEGNLNTDRLIAAGEGLSFDSPKGRMTFRKEDHQAMQPMYHFRIRVDPAVAWGIPELVREIPAAEAAGPPQAAR